MRIARHTHATRAHTCARRSIDNDADNDADFNASAVDAFYKANGGAPVVAAPTNGRKRVVAKVSPKQKASD